MRPGASKAKGNRWERACGATLSLWISGGERSDLFCRTVLSGGQFTVSEGAGIPGDLMANHPAAFSFMALFSVEAKHRASIELERYLLDPGGKNFLAKVFQQTRDQALRVGVSPMVIAKANRMPAIVLLDYAVGMAARDAAIRGTFRWHALHNNAVVMTTLARLTGSVRPTLFLELVGKLQAARPV